MTELQVSQEHIAKVYALRLLSYMEDMATDAMIDLDAAGMTAELSMISQVRDAVQSALAYLEDPDAYIAIESGTDPEPEKDDDGFYGEVDE